jgi:hypothetical protein
MKVNKKIIAAVLGAGIIAAGLTGCTTDSDRVSQNLSTDAEYFRLNRDIVFYNGITDKYVAEVKGRCSVDDSADLTDVVAVTCKVGPNTYTKDYLHVSDNVTWFSLQTEATESNIYSRQIILKPQNIIPDIQVRTGAQD